MRKRGIRAENPDAPFRFAGPDQAFDNNVVSRLHGYIFVVL